MRWKFQVIVYVSGSSRESGILIRSILRSDSTRSSVRSGAHSSIGSSIGSSIRVRSN